MAPVVSLYGVPTLLCATFVPITGPGERRPSGVVMYPNGWVTAPPAFVPVYMPEKPTGCNAVPPSGKVRPSKGSAGTVPPIVVITVAGRAAPLRTSWPVPESRTFSVPPNLLGPAVYLTMPFTVPWPPPVPTVVQLVTVMPGQAAKEPGPEPAIRVAEVVGPAWPIEVVSWITVGTGIRKPSRFGASKITPVGREIVAGPPPGTAAPVCAIVPFTGIFGAFPAECRGKR